MCNLYRSLYCVQNKILSLTIVRATDISHSVSQVLLRKWYDTQEWLRASLLRLPSPLAQDLVLKISHVF